MDAVTRRASPPLSPRRAVPALLALAVLLLMPLPLEAAAPTPITGTSAKTELEGILSGLVNFFTGPIAMTVCIIAVVIAGIGYATSEGNKKQLLGVILGVSIALFAAQLVAYLGRDIATTTGVTIKLQ